MKLIVILESIKLTKQWVATGKISKDIVNKIIDIDPTPTKRFSGWMAKQYIQKNIDDFDELQHTIEDFYRFLERDKTEHKDIFKYKTFQDINEYLPIIHVIFIFPNSLNVNFTPFFH